jgi:hydroxymethylpyrimidine/phosphomethylpyrimidine kinase
VAQPPTLLTIAGSDSGGAAGLQADLKTWTALGVYGMSAVTVVTAQNSERVAQAHFLPPALVAAQIDAVLSDYGATAVKTGFLGRVELVDVVAERLAFWRDRLRPAPFILVDPVLVNHRGEPMFPPEVAAAYRAWLFPLADLLTPNRREAELLEFMEAAVQRKDAETQGRDKTAFSFGNLLPGVQPPQRVLVKGAERAAGEIVDVLWSEEGVARFPQPLLDTANTHGSGDTLSAAICAFVTRGQALPEAIASAQAYTYAALARAAGWRLGAGHGPLGHVD